jgi:hypothetical protein
MTFSNKVTWEVDPAADPEWHGDGLHPSGRDPQHYRHDIFPADSRLGEGWTRPVIS